jgi:septal ring factor EnvC (AmiA/AmiB activator)
MDDHSPERVRTKTDTTSMRLARAQPRGPGRRSSAVSTLTIALTIAAVLMSTGWLAGQQADRVRTEALVRRAAERLQALRQEADRLASQETTLLGDLRKLEVARQIAAEELRQIETDASQVQTELAVVNERLHQLERQEAADRPAIRARLVELYKLGQGRYLRLLLSTSDLRRVGEASRTVAALAQIDLNRVAKHQRMLDEVKAVRGELQLRDRHLQDLRADAVRAHAAADRAAQARGDLIRDIDQRRDLNAQLAGELQTAQQHLQLVLRGLATGAPAAEPATLPLRPFRGDLDWPADGSVLRRFGRTAASRVAASNGIEIAAAEGAPTRAIHDGIVAFADAFAGFGKLVIVDHGAQIFSLYGNLLDLAVQPGARVEGGQLIGTVGTSATGPAALYFELRIDGQPVDPLQWLKKH